MLSRLHTQLEDNHNKLRKLVDMRASEELTKDEFLSLKKEVIDEQANIESRINDIKNSSGSWLDLAEEFLETSFHAKDIIMNGDYEEKRKLLLTLSQNLYLKDKNLEFRFKKTV